MVHGQYQAKRPVTVLAGTYGHPIYPNPGHRPDRRLGDEPGVRHRLLPGGIAAFLTEGAAWLIVAGLAGAAAAACTGFLDLFAIPSGTPHTAARGCT